MTQPGGFSGEPPGQHPGGWPHPGPGAYGLPPPSHQPPGYPRTYGGQPATNGLAIGSLVSSLVGIPAYLMCLPFVGSIVGVVLGVVALRQIGSRHQKGRETAIAGIAIGAIGLVGAIVLLALHSSALFWY